MADHSHKSGSLKQQNKSHKSTHRSKGQLKKEYGGKVDALRPSSKRKAEITRDARKNKAKMQRSHQRKQNKQRDALSAPFLVALIDICDCPHGFETAFQALVAACGGDAHQALEPVTLLSPTSKKRLTFVPCARDIHSIMEVCKVADSVAFVSDVASTLDSLGELFVTALCAQGLPTCIHIATGIASISQKLQSSLRKEHSKMLTDIVQGKVHFVDSVSDARDFLWPLINQSARPIKWRDLRAHMLVDESKFEVSPTDTAVGMLTLSGYVRGRAWDCNELVYLPGVGAFQVDSILAATDPCERRSAHRDAVMASAEAQVLATPTETREPLDMEAAAPSGEDGEQTWPDEDDFAHAKAMDAAAAVEEEVPGEKRRVRVPKGWSSYQAAWIAESASEGEEASDDEDEEEEDEAGGEAEMRDASDSEEDEEHDVPADKGDGHVKFAEESDGGEGEDPAEKVGNYDDTLDADEEQAALAAFRAAADDREFPDEIDTPLEQSARERFAKYRGLQSFRHAPWDPKVLLLPVAS
jgi:pre-rRNA-processing protein TSR1